MPEPSPRWVGARRTVGGPIPGAVGGAGFHDVEPTEASFNVLFPRLRPGGLYVIEDWAWAHRAFGQPRGLIDDIRIDRHWVLIRRSSDVLDPSAQPYDIRRICNDRGRDLVTFLRDRAAARTRRSPGDWLGGEDSNPQ